MQEVLPQPYLTNRNRAEQQLLLRLGQGNGQLGISTSHKASLGCSKSLIPGSLQVSTVTGQLHSGILLIYDPTSQIVVLSSQSRPINGVETPPSNSLVDLQLIRISSIKDIRVLGPKPEGFKPYEAKPITLQDMKNREELAQKRAQEEARRLGVGVTVEGQKIYDSFAKTFCTPRARSQMLIEDRLPVQWVDKSILVAEQAFINPPYTVDSVVSATATLNGNADDSGKSALLARVKHVVWSFRQV